MHVKYAKKVYYRQDKRCPVFLFPEAKVNSVCARQEAQPFVLMLKIYFVLKIQKKVTLILCTTSLTLSKRVIFKSS